MTEFTDIAALRASALAHFKTNAKTYFADNAEMKSLVFTVSQYWADEADDAVHENVFAFREENPDWPHLCTGDEQISPGSQCSTCAPYEGPHAMPETLLDPNFTAVFAWSAFCAEYGGGEGESELATPIAIARRGVDGGVDLELTPYLVRPWMDRDTVAQNRDTDSWQQEAPPPKPEPVRAPWTTRERQLLDAVLADPTNDAPRRVLVDHWLEQGDVRGEFGALSFSTPDAKDLRLTRQALADEHGRRWLGPLQPVISLAGADFARGPFVSRAVVSFGSSAEAQASDSLEDWGLLDAIRFTGEHGRFNENMRGLTEVTGVTAAALKSLSGCTLVAPIRTLGVTGRITKGDWCDALNGVRKLIIETADHLEDTVFAPFEQFEAIEVWVSADAAWQDNRAVAALNHLAGLAPHASLLVGYQMQSGLHAGVVATVAPNSTDVQLRDLQYAGEGMREAARTRIAALPPLKRSEIQPPLPTPSFTPKPPPSALRKFFGRFGL